MRALTRAAVIGLVALVPAASASAGGRVIEQQKKPPAEQKKFERPPYFLTLTVEPGAGATQFSSVKLRARRGGTYVPSTMACTWEAVPTAGGRAQRSRGDDYVCGGQNFVLDPGTYRLRVTYSFLNQDGSYAEGSSEKAGYVVTAAPRLEVTSLTVPASAATGQTLNMKMVIKNTGGARAPAVPYQFTRGVVIAAAGTTTPLEPGREIEAFGSFTPSEAGAVTITGTVDAGNQLQVVAELRGTLSRTANVQVVQGADRGTPATASPCRSGFTPVTTPSGPGCVNSADASSCTAGGKSVFVGAPVCTNPLDPRTCTPAAPPGTFACRANADCSPGYVCSTSPCGGVCLRSQPR